MQTTPDCPGWRFAYDRALAGKNAFWEFNMSPMAYKFAIVLAAASLSSLAVAQTSSSLSSADQKFIKEAAQGGMAEVELGQLAIQNASSEQVKKFGQRMVTDHSKANDQLKELAASKGVTLPQTPGVKE